jgi:cytochrome c oxidase assembly protein subunit 15
LIALGSLVRATDSGLACPDWPLCYGKAIPTFDFQIFLEWFHRVVAGTLTVFVVVAAVKVFRSRVLRRAFFLQIVAAGVLLLVQIVLGGLTVLKLLDPSTVSAHLTNALLFLTVMVWMAMRARFLAAGPSPLHRVPLVLKRKFAAVTGLVFLQTVLGGMVSTNHAGLVCPDFPTCHGQWLPPLDFLVGLQLGHRVLAFVVLAAAIALASMASRANLPPAARRAAKLLPALVILQIALGLVNVLYALPDLAVVAHLANAAIMYTLMLTGTLELAHRAKGIAKADLARAAQAARSPVLGSAPS